VAELLVRLDELLSARSAARDMPRALDRLVAGEVKQLVLTTNGRPRAVMLTVERYEQLLAQEARA